MLTASLLTSLALKSLALAAITLGVLRLMRSRTPAERSLIAHLGLLAVLLLPIGSILLPQWAPLPQDLFASNEVASVASETPLAVHPADIPTSSEGVAAAGPSFSPPTLAELAVWIYALPLALMFVMMAAAVFRLFAMRRRAEVLVDGAWLSALAEAQRRMGFKHGTALLVSEELRSPISWGVLRPTILLDPRAVSAVREAEAIIAHELAHVARLDWAKLLIARLACALFWFNPLVWLLARESHHLREEAADDAVLLTDIAGSDYATLLVNAARHDNRAVLIAAHGVAPAKNSLKRRVIRVLDANASRGPVGTGWGVLGLASVLAVATPLAAFTTVAAERADLSGATEADAERMPTVTERDRVALAPDTQATVSAEDLVSMRAMDVTPADVAEMRDSGEGFDANDVIAAKATGVTPDYMAEMRSVFGAADVDELVGARAVGVDAAYARAMRAADASADLDAIIGARAVGLTAAYVRELRGYFPRATLEELIGMRAVGVTGTFVESMRASGLNVATPDDVISVRAVTSRRGPPPVPRGPQAISVSRTGATAIAGPGGVVSTHHTEDGTSTAVILSDTRSDPRDD